MKGSRAPVPPRVSPRPKRGGLLSSSRAMLKNGGLCGHCSRDLPLDRRLLFVAELTGQGWWVVSVTLRRRSGWTAALQAARGLYAANNPCVVLEMVDRHGFAPCSSACKADDLLNDRAAREKSCGGRDRTGDTRRMKPLPCHLATPLL